MLKATRFESKSCFLCTATSATSACILPAHCLHTVCTLFVNCVQRALHCYNLNSACVALPIFHLALCAVFALPMLHILHCVSTIFAQFLQTLLGAVFVFCCASSHASLYSEHSVFSLQISSVALECHFFV